MNRSQLPNRWLFFTPVIGIVALLAVSVCLPQANSIIYRNLGAMHLTGYLLTQAESGIMESSSLPENELQTSVAYLVEELRQNPESASANRLLSVVAYAQGDNTQAELRATRAIREVPSDVIAHFLLGNLYFQQQKIAQAIDSWKQAGAAPFFASECYRLYYAEGIRAAVEQCRLAWRIDPNKLSVEGRLVMASNFYEDGDRANAEREYLSAVAVAKRRNLDYDVALANGELGVFYARERRFPDAVMALQSSLDRLPENPYYCLWLGGAYRELGQMDLAETEYWKAYETDVTDYRAIAAFRLAQLFQEQKELGNALSLYEEAVALSPDNLEFRSMLASAYLEANDLVGANAECGAILRVQPENELCSQVIEP